MDHLITGMFRDRSSAEHAVDDLAKLGFNPNDISIMMNDLTRTKEFAAHTGTKAAEGVGVGASLGGALGAIVAGLTATGSVAVLAATGGAATPLVAGPLAAVLAGAGAGGIGGGILGGLVGAGIPEDRARTYETGLNSGGILVGVHPNGINPQQVRQVLTADGAADIQG